MGYRARTNGKNKKIRQLEKECNILKVRNKILEKVVINTNEEYYTKFLKLEKLCFDTQKVSNEALEKAKDSNNFLDEVSETSLKMYKALRYIFCIFTVVLIVLFYIAVFI